VLWLGIWPAPGSSAELRPLERIAGTARPRGGHAAGQRLRDADERVDVDAPDTEVGHVLHGVNAMLGHVEGALEVRAASEERLRRFVADASHELRTPLASIPRLRRRLPQARPDGARRAAGDPPGGERTAQRMSGLVDDLLLLARSTPRRPARRAPGPCTRAVDIGLPGGRRGSRLRAADPVGRHARPARRRHGRSA